MKREEARAGEKHRPTCEEVGELAGRKVGHRPEKDLELRKGQVT